MRSGTVVNGEAYLMEKWKRVEKNWRWPTTPETPAQFLYLKTKFPQRDARTPVNAWLLQ